MNTKLIIGLGNPEPHRALNRHNIGRILVKSYIKFNNIQPGIFRGAQNIAVNYSFSQQSNALFLRPEDGMNLSGVPVNFLCGDLKIAPENILVIHDDIDFEFGIVRIKQGGGSGRHKGIQSIIDVIGPNFLRLRMGIGKPKEGTLLQHVLSDFSVRERDCFCELSFLGTQIIKSFLINNNQKVMSEFNK